MSEHSLFRSVLSGSAVVATAKVSGVGLLFLMHVVLARLLPDSDQYGYVVWALSLAQVLSVVAVLGMSQTTLRFASRYVARGQWELYGCLVKIATKVVLATGVLIAAFLTCWFLVAGSRYGSTPKDQVSLIVALTIPLLALGDLNGRIAQARHWYVLSFLPERVLRPLFVMAGYGLAYLVSGRAFDAMFAAWVIFFSAIGWVSLQAILVAMRGDPVRGAGSCDTAVADIATESRAWRQASVPFFVVGVMSIAMHYGDILMLGLLSNAAETGAYFAANRLAQLVSLPLFIVGGVLAPRFSEFETKGERGRLQLAATMGAHLSLWPTLGIAMLMLSLPELFLGLFGTEYAGANAVLAVLVIGHVFNVATGLGAVLLNMTGNQRLSAYLLGIALLLNLVLNFSLIPRYGAFGAGVANAVCFALLNAGAYLFVRRRLKMDSSVLASMRRT